MKMLLKIGDFLQILQHCFFLQPHRTLLFLSPGYNPSHYINAKMVENFYILLVNYKYSKKEKKNLFPQEHCIVMIIIYSLLL